jgi:hypothetical protein
LYPWPGPSDVLTQALQFGVPVWVAPLVAPAVDLSILGLLLGTGHLALYGATSAELRPARRLLIFASLATLASNIADPIVTGAYGKAAFDAVGPLLLIGWAEVGLGLLRAIASIPRRPSTLTDFQSAGDGTGAAVTDRSVATWPREAEVCAGHDTDRLRPESVDGDLIDRARARTPGAGSSTRDRSPPSHCARACVSALPSPGHWCRSFARARPPVTSHPPSSRC